MRGSGPKQRPHDKGQRGDHKHRKNEISRNDIGESLDRRARALSLADHADDLSKQGLAADTLSLHHNTAGRVYGAASYFASF